MEAPKAKTGKALNIEGQRFNRMLVISRADSDKNGNARWNCVCDCGEERTVHSQSLRNGSTQSCGCLNKDSRPVKHGASGEPVYKAWHGMIQRCTNKGHHKWHRYGGRGITVCERWLKFENFIEDMGTRPVGMSVDREDNNGNYEPGNCRWATPLQQGSNRSTNVYVLIDDELLTLSSAARRFGIHKSTVMNRIRSGWEPLKAVTTPVKKGNENATTH